MRTRAFFGGVVFCVMAVLAAAQNRDAPAVPGQKVGPVRLGSVLPARLRGQKPWAELVVRTPSGKSSWVSVYSAAGHGASPVVRAVRIASPEWKLAGGISTATSIAQIRRAFRTLRLVATYRNPYFGEVAVWEAPAQGIAFDFSSGTSPSNPNKCLVITVFQPHNLIPALLADPSLKPTMQLRRRH